MRLFDAAAGWSDTVYGSLAQLVEQLAFNQLVTGSNPVRPTIIKGVDS